MKNTTQKVGPQNPVKEKPSETDNLKHYVALYQLHLFQTATELTYERYVRVLNRFAFDYFPEKTSTFEFLRADMEDYRELRLKEGASRTTVGIELSILRGFWKFLVRMDAAFMNVVLNVKVPNPDRKKKSLAFPDLVGQSRTSGN